MEFAIVYAVLAFLVHCADARGEHGPEQKLVRALFWPLTLTSWFRTQAQQLHFLLTILWTMLIAGWFITLILDRIG